MFISSNILFQPLTLARMLSLQVLFKEHTMFWLHAMHVCCWFAVIVFWHRHTSGLSFWVFERVQVQTFPDCHTERWRTWQRKEGCSCLWRQTAHLSTTPSMTTGLTTELNDSVVTSHLQQEWQVMLQCRWRTWLRCKFERNDRHSSDEPATSCRKDWTLLRRPETMTEKPKQSISRNYLDQHQKRTWRPPVECMTSQMERRGRSVIGGESSLPITREGLRVRCREWKCFEPQNFLKEKSCQK